MKLLDVKNRIRRRGSVQLLTDWMDGCVLGPKKLSEKCTVLALERLANLLRNRAPMGRERLQVGIPRDTKFQRRVHYVI